MADDRHTRDTPAHGFPPEETPTAPGIGNPGNLDQLKRHADELAESSAHCAYLQAQYDLVFARKELVPKSWDARFRARCAAHLDRAAANLDRLIDTAPECR